MLSFIDLDLFPSGKTVGEGPAISCESDTAEDRNVGVFQTPESGRKRVRIVEWRRRGSHCGNNRGGVSMVTSGDRERFDPGENEGQDKGSYKSKDSTGEKARGCG